MLTSGVVSGDSKDDSQGGAGYATGSQSSDTSEEGLREAYFNPSSEEEELSSSSSDGEAENPEPAQWQPQRPLSEAGETLVVTLQQLEAARETELRRDFEDTHQPFRVRGLCVGSSRHDNYLTLVWVI